MIGSYYGPRVPVKDISQRLGNTILISAAATTAVCFKKDLMAYYSFLGDWKLLRIVFQTAHSGGKKVAKDKIPTAKYLGYNRLSTSYPHILAT